MGYQGKKLLDCGQYIIDKIDISAPPSTVNIDGIATSVNQALRTRNSRGFEETTLAIASRIAQTHGLKLVGKIEPLTIDRVTQYGETDVGFLKRGQRIWLCGKGDHQRTDFFAFTHAALHGAGKTIDRKDVSHFTFKDTINRIYKMPPYSIKIVRKKRTGYLHPTASKTVCPWSRHQCRHAKTEQSGAGRWRGTGKGQRRARQPQRISTNRNAQDDGLPGTDGGQ